MDVAAQVTDALAALGVEPAAGTSGGWRLDLEAAGHPLQVSLSTRGPLLRAEALVLPAEVIDPRQLLFWNRQAPLVCFAHDGNGDVLVCGELPLATLEPELLDRFLGLLVSCAVRAREFVLPSASGH